MRMLLCLFLLGVYLKMLSSILSFLLAAGIATGSPVVVVKNGSYSGIYNPTYHQDLFLGIPYAQAS